MSGKLLTFKQVFLIWIYGHISSEPYSSLAHSILIVQSVVFRSIRINPTVGSAQFMINLFAVTQRANCFCLSLLIKSCRENFSAVQTMPACIDIHTGSFWGIIHFSPSKFRIQIFSVFTVSYFVWV